MNLTFLLHGPQEHPAYCTLYRTIPSQVQGFLEGLAPLTAQQRTSNLMEFVVIKSPLCARSGSATPYKVNRGHLVTAIS